MFASSSYFRNAASNQLMPVFDYTASPFVDPSLKIKATWGLFGGPGSLPTTVIYYGIDGDPSAIYTVLESTNVGTFILPIKFYFNQPTTGYKDVTAVVTAVHQGCSRKNLLPALTAKATMIDFRWKPDLLNGGFATYGVDHWPSLSEARKLYERDNGDYDDNPRQAPFLVRVAIIVLLIAPPIWMFVLHKNRRPAKPRT
jgi:hypothetical protein